uniref:Uncharacterized protein n=1 Tax=Setaria italica TaxID=4555 RepID=K4AGV3_SETIT
MHVGRTPRRRLLRRRHEQRRSSHAWQGITQGRRSSSRRACACHLRRRGRGRGRPGRAAPASSAAEVLLLRARRSAPSFLVHIYSQFLSLQNLHIPYMIPSLLVVERSVLHELCC